MSNRGFGGAPRQRPDWLVAHAEKWRRRARWVSLLGAAVIAPIAFALWGAYLPTTSVLKAHSHLLAASVMSTLLLVGTVLIRDRLGRDLGTLYYVRLFEAPMIDWHIGELRKDAGARLDLRVVSRYLLRDRRADPTFVDDLADTVAEAGLDLQRAMNEDDPNTAFHLAPNLLWPWALSLGYNHFAWAGTVLLEFHPDPSKRINWRPFDPRTYGVVPEVRTSPRGSDPAALVIADLSDTDGATRLDTYAIGRVYRVAVFRDQSGDLDDPRQTVQVRGVNQPTTSGSALVSPWTATAVCVDTIRKAIHENPDGPVLLSLRIPKTVALALGLALRTAPCPVEGCTQPACINPWSVLVPMNFEQGVGALTYAPVRVHPHQPPAAAMELMLKKCLRR